MYITDSEVAIILELPHKQLKIAPAGYSSILVGVRVKITNIHNRHGLEGVG